VHGVAQPRLAGRVVGELGGVLAAAPSVTSAIPPLARLLRMPAMPITPTLLPLPLPARYHLHLGKPLSFSEVILGSMG
jgi:hypothetical protein